MKAKNKTEEKSRTATARESLMLADTFLPALSDYEEAWDIIVTCENEAASAVLETQQCPLCDASCRFRRSERMEQSSLVTMICNGCGCETEVFVVDDGSARIVRED